jgi:hypothetical protein
MWTCPKCKQRFYNKNQWHSCGRFSVNDFLSGKTSKAVDLFNSFLEKYKEIGEFELHPVKTRVTLLTLMRFASVNKLGQDHLDAHLVLTAPSDNPDLFFKVENLNNRFFVHHFRIHEPEEITPELFRAMKKAYAVGLRNHVKPVKKKP